MEDAYPGGGPLIRQALLARGHLPASASISAASLQASAVSTYSTSLRRWWQFTRSRPDIVLNPSTSDVLEFLTSEFQRGISYSALNCAASALALLSNSSGHPDPLVQRFLKGVANLRPPRPKYNTTWDPQVVLEFLRSRPDTCSLELLELSKKLLILLALTTGQRLQTISSIALPNIVRDATQTTIFIPDRIKTSRPGKNQPLLVLPLFPEEKLLSLIHI